MELKEITNLPNPGQSTQLFFRKSSSYRLAMSAGLVVLMIFSWASSGKAGEPIRFSPMDGDTRTKVSIPWQLTLGNSHGQADALISLLRNRSGSGPDTPLADYWGVDMSGSQGGSVNRAKLAEILKGRGDKISEKSLDDYFGNTDKAGSFWEGSEGGYGDSAYGSSNRRLSSSSRLEDFYLDSLQRDSQKGSGSNAQSGSLSSNSKKSWDQDDNDPYAADESESSDGASGGWGTGVQSFQAGGQQDTSTSQESPSKQFMAGMRPNSGVMGPEDRAAQGMSVYEPVGKTEGSIGSDFKSGDQKMLLANGMEASLGGMRSVDGSSSLSQEQRQQNAFMKVFSKTSKWQVEDYWGGSIQSSSVIAPKSIGNSSSLAPEDGSSLFSMGVNSSSSSNNGSASGAFAGASNNGFLSNIPKSGTASITQSRVLGATGQGQVSGFGAQGSNGPSFDQLLKGSSSSSIPTPSAGSGNWFDSGNPLPKPSLRSVPTILSIPQRPGVF
jgi:hypothetical protein